MHPRREFIGPVFVGVVAVGRVGHATSQHGGGHGALSLLGAAAPQGFRHSQPAAFGSRRTAWECGVAGRGGALPHPFGGAFCRKQFFKLLTGDTSNDIISQSFKEGDKCGWKNNKVLKVFG